MNMELMTYVSILVSAIAMFAVGALWYTVLFGKLWQKLMKFSADDMKHMPLSAMQAMVFGFLSSLVTAYVLNMFVYMWSAVDMGSALSLGFFVWLGFTGPVALHTLLWDGKPLKLFLINAGHLLVAVCVGSYILVLL